LFAPTSLRNRLVHLLGAAAALIAAAGWWVLTVQLVPATARPYIGGSTDNTVMQLAVGYNGMTRILGRDRNRAANLAVPATGHGWSRLGGGTGLRRLFTAEMANEISWLLPAALLAIAYGCYLLARGRLGRGEKASLTMFAGWLLGSALVFSYMSGMVHPYYTVAMAPAVAGLVGIGAAWGWRDRSGWDGRVALAAMIVLTAVWSGILLHRNHFGPRPRRTPDRHSGRRGGRAGRGRRSGGVLDRHRRHPTPGRDSDSTAKGRRPARQLDR
jgi:4-amino-4-deoxy-L-arabinose transferase-like glycosyltransferase